MAVRNVFCPIDAMEIEKYSLLVTYHYGHIIMYTCVSS